MPIARAKVPEDAELVEACRSNDPAGIASVVERHGDRLYRTLCLIVKDAEDARDLSQETFVRFLRSMDEYRGDVSLRGWLLTIGTRLALNRLRDRQRPGAGQQWLSTDALDERDTGVTPPESGPEEVVIRRLQTRDVQAFLDTLTPPLRAVAVLRFYEEMPYETIARVLGINLGTVRSRLNAVRWQARTAFARR